MITFSRILFKKAPLRARLPHSGQTMFQLDDNGDLEQIDSDGNTAGVNKAKSGAPVLGVVATATLTSNATAPSDGATVTVGGRVYTFQTTLTNVAGNVLIGASAATALDNLKSAVNLTAGAGTEYAAATTIHPDVTATTNTDTTQAFDAKVAGTLGNALASTETDATLSFGAATFTSGIDATAASLGTTYVDGTNFYVATADVVVSSLTGWRKVAHSAL